MEIKNIHVYLPRFARGTPIRNPRDGPVAGRVGKNTYHPFGVSHTPRCHLFYNPTIPYGITTQPQRDETIIRWNHDVHPQSRRPALPVGRDAMIIEDSILNQTKTRRVDMIIEDIPRYKTKPRRGEITIPYGITTQPQRNETIIITEMKCNFIDDQIKL